MDKGDIGFTLTMLYILINHSRNYLYFTRNTQKITLDIYYEVENCPRGQDVHITPLGQLSKSGYRMTLGDDREELYPFLNRRGK